MKHKRKIDLHCHLDGSLPPDTIRRLAKRSGISLPENRQEQHDLFQAPENCGSLAAYLKCFDLPVACLQTEENLREAAHDVLLEAWKDDIMYMEIRFAPRLHTEKGRSLHAIIESVVEGVKQAQAECAIRAGIIVCGMRDQPVRKNIEMLEAAMAFYQKGVCGLDIAGDEAGYPPAVQRELFEEALHLGIPFTVHGGECGSWKNVMDAIEMGAKRIGHGIALKDNREAMDECARRQVALELCPVSNLQTKAVANMEEYPLRTFMKAGIPVTVNTDNRTVSNTTMKKEIELLKCRTGLTEEEEKRLFDNSIRYSFADDSVKEELIKQTKGEGGNYVL